MQFQQFIPNKQFKRLIILVYLRFKLQQIKTSNNLQELDYNYDSVGNILGINDIVNLREFNMQYDDLDRLIYTEILNYSEGVDKNLNYSYNSIGNMLDLKFDDYNMSFNYQGNQVHAPSEMIKNIALPDDENKFEIDMSGDTVGWLGDEGNIVLKGKCYPQTICQTPIDNSFIIANLTDDTTAFINESGDLCIEKGDCSDLSLICNSSREGFIVRNFSGDNMVYLDYDGDLCLTGKLYENIEI